MAPLTRRTPPNQGPVLARRYNPTTSASQDKLRSVADKATFKAVRKDPLSQQFTKLSMAELASDSGKVVINGYDIQLHQQPPVGSKLLSNLLDQQTRFLPHPDYLKKVQKDTGIEDFMRHELMSWLLQLNKHFEYHPETFGVATNLFDRILSQMKVQPRYLQLIAATSLLLAAKMQEAWNTHPSLKELTVAGNNHFSCADLERMEKLMLQKLKWEVNPVTSYVLLHQVVPHLDLPSWVPTGTLIQVAEDILDACHLEYRFLQYKPSTLAASASLLALTRWAGVDREMVRARLMVLIGSRCDMLDRCLEDMRLLNWDVAPML